MTPEELEEALTESFLILMAEDRNRALALALNMFVFLHRVYVHSIGENPEGEIRLTGKSAIGEYRSITIHPTEYRNTTLH